MGFLSDIFHRSGRVVRGQANAGMSAVEDATFEATVKQTVADMRTELNNAIQGSAVAMSNYNRLDAEYQKYVRQSQEWKDRANQALDANNEDLAKKALAKKAECDRQVASMQASVDSARQASENLKTQVMELKKQDRRGRAHGDHPGGAQERGPGAAQSGRSAGRREQRRQRVRRARLVRGEGGARRGHGAGVQHAGIRRQGRRPGEAIRRAGHAQRGLANWKR